MTPQEFYTSQSFITDPKEYSYLYDDLPRDIPSLCRILQGLVLHYVAERHLVGGLMPYERLCEIDTRYVPRIYERLLAMDSHPLTEARTPANRFVGCCRDFSVLFCSMLRHFGIPARTRSGFAAYFAKGYYGDHVVVEYWNGTNWQLVDPELPPAEHWGFDVTNVPRDRFIVGGQAWQMARNGEADPDRFGLGPDVPIYGWGFMRGRLMQDLAALNKHEMLCWDQWSYADPELVTNPEEDALMDQVAAITQGGDATFDEIRALFTYPRLAIPTPMKSWSPAQERLLDVTLAV
jgi:hypothetical protein